MRKEMKLKDVLPLTVGPVDVVTLRGTYEMEYIAGEVFGDTTGFKEALLDTKVLSIEPDIIRVTPVEHEMVSTMKLSDIVHTLKDALFIYEGDVYTHDIEIAAEYASKQDTIDEVLTYSTDLESKRVLRIRTIEVSGKTMVEVYLF